MNGLDRLLTEARAAVSMLHAVSTIPGLRPEVVQAAADLAERLDDAQRCHTPRPSLVEVVAALHDAADEIERLVDDQHPAALNPDQWLRDRADALGEVSG